MDNSAGVISIADDLKMIQPPSPHWPESANVYVFKDDDGISLFDVGCGSMTSVDRLFRAIKAAGWGSRPIKKIILSHAHPDHAGAMEILLSEASPEHIILHEIDLPYAVEPEKLPLSFDIPLCEERLAGGSGEDKEWMKGEGFNLIGYFRALGCSMCRVKPDRTVVEGDTIPVGHYNFDCLHTPGHAPGHMSLYDPKNQILLAGDILGEIVAWYSPSSGGALGYLESLKKVSSLDIDLALPSHGNIISDTKQVIGDTEDKILGKDRVILKALQTGSKSFEELNNILFEQTAIRFFPGTPILESHLQKLIAEKRIRKDRSISNFFLA